jgi:hypothetical protein
LLLLLLLTSSFSSSRLEGRKPKGLLSDRDGII